MNIILELRSQLESLSKTNKRIVEFILKNPSVVLENTAAQLGELSQTSSASIIRFVHALGYKGLDEFKIELAKELSTQDDVLSISGGINQNDDLETLCLKTQSLIDQTNRDLFYQLKEDQLAQAIKIVQDAKHVYLFGIGASSLAAYDLYHKFNRIQKQSVFNFDSHMTVEFLHYLEKTDCVIVYSYSGHSREVVEAAVLAKSKGVKVIAITQNAPSPLSENADIILTVPNNEPAPRVGAIASKFSIMLISDLLYLGVIQKDLKKVEKNLLETSKLTRKLKL